MPLKDAQISAVKALVDQAPDSAVWALETALKNDQSGGATAVIRDLVNAEAVERRACAEVLSPVMQLCGPPANDLVRLNFPPHVPRRLWRALKETSRSEVEHAVAAWLGRAWSETSPPVFDKLCARAAKGLREGEPAFQPVADLLPAGSEASLGKLSLVLELAPLARAAVQHLPQWLNRTTSAHAAAMRLIYKDAVARSEGAGALLLEVIFGHLAEPWRVMKIVAALMDTPNERYVAASELASFPVRLLDSIDKCVEAVRELGESKGAQAGASAAQGVERALATLNALETSLSLQKDGPWSKRLTHQRRALATGVEARFVEIEAALNAALPLQSSRTAAKALTGLPKLVHPPEPRLIARAAALLEFIEQTRSVADGGGFGTLRTRAHEAAQTRLDQYAEDLLEMRRAGASPEEAQFIGQYLEAAAGLVAVLQGDKAANVLRRRAAA